MPLTGAQNQSFTTINAVAAEDKLQENEVPTALNIDFSFEDHAAAVRQGTVQIGSLDFAAEIDTIFRYYNSASYGSAPWYLAEGGRIHRVTGGFGAPSAAQIASGGGADPNDLPVFSAYREHVFMADGTNALKDNGTATEPWIKPRPTGAVSATMITLTPLAVIGTYTVHEAVTAQETNEFTGTGTLDTNASTFRGEFRQVPVVTNLNTNTGNTIGNNGVHHIDMKFDEPKFVTRISLDYSIGNVNFDNYFHAEFDVEDVANAVADTDVLLEEEVEIITDQPAALESIAQAKAEAARQLRPAKMRVSTSKNTFNTISIPNTSFEFVGKSIGSGWQDIRSCRVVIETWGPVNVEVRNWVIAGAENYSLHDPNIGYTYWETWAVKDSNGNTLSESAPSPVSGQYKVVSGQGIVVSTNASPGAWATHRILYRKGGRLLAPYAVSTNTVAVSTYTDTLSDIKALLANNRMQSYIRSSMPNGVRAISDPYKDRLFVGYDNNLIWSLPGRPDTFLNASETVISHENDRVQALHVIGDILICVNRDSVYELRGSVFEGDFQDWQIRKSSAAGGSVAPRCAINTPYGILLVRDAGIFFYIPGQGVEQPLGWAMDKIRDIFKGNGAFDPAQQKGSRVGVGMDQAALQHCVAAYKDETIYIGWPSSASSSASNRANLVLKLDMRRQRVSIFQYPWSIRSMWPDRESNALLFGTTDGLFIRSEQGLNDVNAAGASVGVGWSMKTRKWSVDNDTVYENLNVEYRGGACTVKAEYDSTNTTTIGTINGSARDWHNPPFNGVFGNELQLSFTGTQSDARDVLWNLKWDAIAHPYRRKFWRTEHFTNNYEGDKQWHVLYSDIEVVNTANVTGVVYIDNTAVMTQTITGPTNGRIIEQTSFPVDTYGELAYVIYTSTGDFKLWDTSYTATNEPPTITALKTPVESLEEHLFEGVDFDVNPMGTLTSTVFIDNSPVGTFTTVGNARQSYTHVININQYGRTIYTIHNGTFKHYKTWYHKRLEPDRWLNYQWGPDEYDEERWLRTWMCELNPLGGTVIGTLYADGVATVLGTFTGNQRQSFVTGLDLDNSDEIRSASRVEVDYTASTVFKHYKTQIENAPKPFDKYSWVYAYSKMGGASEVDMAESYALDIESAGTATITCMWDVDGRVYDTQTLTFTGREWKDNIVPPPGMRGRLFRQRLKSAQRFRVWTAQLDVYRTGRKGVSVVAIKGTPN